MDGAQRDAYGLHERAIEWAIEIVTHRWRLRFDEAQDFAQDVRVYFLEHERHVRVVDGRAHPRAYFFRIVARRAIDWRRRMSGRWRTSPKTKKAGEIATILHDLLGRRGLTMSEAIETVHISHGTPRALVERTAQMLNRRHAARTLVPWDNEKCHSIADPMPSASPLRIATQRDALGCANRVAVSLERALALLNPRERRLVVDHFAQPLSPTRRPGRYGQDLRRVLSELRQMLASAGVDASQTEEAVESGALERYALIVSRT